MAFDSFSDFLAMGKYAAYVWSAFGLTFLCLLLLWVNSRMQEKALKKEIRQKLAREERELAARKMENTL